MKKIFLITIGLFIFNATFAQNKLEATGDVGIGTVDPQHTLDVRGNGSFTGPVWFGHGNNNIRGYSWTNAALTTNSIEIVNNNSTVNNLSPTLAFHRYGSGGPQFRLSADGSSVLYLESSGANSARDPAPYGGGTNSYFSRLHIDGQISTVGNIGIGVSSPNARLHVDGQLIGNSSAIQIGTANPGNIYVPIGAPTGGYNLDFQSWRDALPEQIGARIQAQRINVYQENNALVQGMDLAFSTSNGWVQADLTERLRIKHDGKIGIGTRNPDAMLTVKGGIHAEEVKVDLSIPVPDYVFHKNYKLMTLGQIGEYVNTYHHLPEIPSAKDIAKDGISLGEMDMKLLKKVEELTLYLLEKDKQLIKQQQQLNQQARRILALEQKKNKKAVR